MGKLTDAMTASLDGHVVDTEGKFHFHEGAPDSPSSMAAETDPATPGGAQ